MALPKSFSFSPYQGRAGQGPQFGQVLTAATDQLGDFAEADKLEAEKIAMNEIFAKAAQSGNSIAEIQRATPGLLEGADPSLIDAKAIMAFQDDRVADASSLLVNEAGIRADDAATYLRNEQGKQIGPNAEAQRALQKAQQEEAKARAERQGTLAEREAEEYLEEQRIIQAVAEMSDFYFNGGLDAELNAQYDEFATAEGFSQEQADAYRNVWNKYQSDAVQSKPDYLLKLAARFDLTPPQFVKYSELGRQYKTTIDAAAEQEVAQAKIDSDAEKAYQTGVDAYLGNDYSSAQIGPSGVTFGKSTNQISGPDAKAFAKQEGYNVRPDSEGGNANHRDAVESLRANFPDQGSFQYALKMLKNSEGRIADNLPTVITQLREQIEAAAADQVAKRTQSLYDGRSPNEIVKEMIEAANSRAQVNIPADNDVDTVTKLLDEPGYELPTKPETIDGQVAAIKTVLAKANEDIASLSAETKEDLRIPLQRIAKDMDRMTAAKTSYADKKRFAAQMSARLNRIMEAEAKNIQRKQAAADKKKSKEARQAETDALATALLNAQ